jgi:sortase A
MKNPSSSRKKILRFSAVITGLCGIVILFGSVWPIIDYRLQNRETGALLVPLSNVGINSRGEVLDFTKASNWFPEAEHNKEFTASKISFYNISIPKLKIENATVAIGGEDLSKSLVQYPGTALPGKRGNAAIFGHSILPIFFDPKNYMAIFSTLPTLKKGDEISIQYDGVSYKYIVEEKFEVLPTDIQVLQQDPSDSFLTLVTCVPPGDPRKPKRLIVRARIAT